MKFYKRYLSVFVACVLLFATFCTTVSADELDTTTFKVNILASAILPTEVISYGQLDINNNSVGSKLSSHTITMPSTSTTISFQNKLTFFDTSAEPIFLSGNTYKFKVNNLIQGYWVGENDSNIHVSYLNFMSGFYIYSDGTYSDTFTSGVNYSYNPNTKTYSLSMDITPDKDVYKLVLVMSQNVPVSSSLLGKSNIYGMKYGSTLDSSSSSTPLKITIEQDSKEVGLLSGIIEWIKSIFNKIGDIFDTVSSGFANIGSWFAELPGKIWSVIKDGLINLFVPDTEYMSNYSKKWDSLLSSRFGAIYDVATIIIDFVSQITTQDVTNTIYMPIVSLNSVGIPFIFGGYDIKIVPDNFTILIEVIKKIISISCTFLFINSLRKRYDEVMGVEQ